MNKAEIFEHMHRIGLIESETIIYLRLLETGKVGISELSKKINIPRTTVVENIERLLEKGLVNKGIANNKLVISAEPPSKLKLTVMNKRISLQDQVDEIKTIDENLPQLIDGIKGLIKKPVLDTHISVKYYEGRKGARLIYFEAFSARELRSYVNLGETHKVFPENNELFVVAQLKNPSILIREIIDESPESYKKASGYAKRSNFQFKCSSIPTNLASINILMFDGKVAMINFKDPIVISIMTNNDYYENSVAIFDYLWETLK